VTVQKVSVEEAAGTDFRWNSSAADPAIPRKWYVSDREAKREGVRTVQTDVNGRVKPGVETVGQVSSIRATNRQGDTVLRVGLSNETSAQKPVVELTSELPAQFLSLSSDWIDLQVAVVLNAEDAAIFRGSAYTIDFDASAFATQVSDTIAHQMVGGRFQRMFRASARAFCKAVIPAGATLSIRIRPTFEFDWRNTEPYVSLYAIVGYAASYLALAPAAAGLRDQPGHNFELIDAEGSETMA